MALLALLMAGTSGAVASWASIWLVPPYLILMALLLAPPAGRPQGDPDGGGSESPDHLRPARPVGGLDDPEASEDGPASAGRPEGESGQGPASGPAKARRGKARGKKARQPVPGPTEATWVQVAPGKFVRVEASETSGQAGPHAPVGVPVEVPTTPRPPENGEAQPSESANGPPGGNDLAAEPLEDAGSAPFDNVEGGPGGDPTGDVESESTATFEVDETAGSPGSVEGTPAADGNAPRAGDPFEGTEAGWPDVGSERAVDDRGWAGAEGEGSEPGEAPAEDPGPTAAPTLADVPPEDADEWGATLEGTDPTETPVDETDLDDAGPLELAPPEPGPSRDADAPETDAFPGPSGGSDRRPGRLAPPAWTRVGHPPRALDRRATPRRPVRSPGPARRPTDPRRISRRGLGRSRQVIRTFPPRSPPRGRAGRGGFLPIRSCAKIWIEAGCLLFPCGLHRDFMILCC